MQNMFIPYPNFCKKFDCDTILFNNMINFCIFRVKNINNVFILYNSNFCYTKMKIYNSIYIRIGNF